MIKIYIRVVRREIIEYGRFAGYSYEWEGFDGEIKNLWEKSPCYINNNHKEDIMNQVRKRIINHTLSDMGLRDKINQLYKTIGLDMDDNDRDSNIRTLNRLKNIEINTNVVFIDRDPIRN